MIDNNPPGSELQVAPETTAAEIDAVFQRAAPQTVELSPRTSPSDLVRIIEEVRASMYGRPFLELLAAQPIDASAAWNALLEDPVDPGVAMAALENAAVPDQHIARLLRHPTEQVRGHALLAQLRRTLPRMTSVEIEALLEAHAGDEGVSLGVRHLVARTGGTPRHILERLADDDADFIARCARERVEATKDDTDFDAHALERED